MLSSSSIHEVGMMPPSMTWFSVFLRSFGCLAYYVCRNLVVNEIAGVAVHCGLQGWALSTGGNRGVGGYCVPQGAVHRQWQKAALSILAKVMTRGVEVMALNVLVK